LIGFDFDNIIQRKYYYKSDKSLPRSETEEADEIIRRLQGTRDSVNIEVALMYLQLKALSEQIDKQVYTSLQIKGTM